MEWDLDYDTKTGKLDSSNVFATYRHADYSFTMGFAHLDTLTGATSPGGSTTERYAGGRDPEDRSCGDLRHQSDDESDASDHCLQSAAAVSYRTEAPLNGA